MPDIEKVIKGLELCTNISQDGCLMLCPYKDEKDETYSGFCEQVLKLDALALLKEKEAIEPIKAPFPDASRSDGSYYFICGACSKPIDPNDKYCRECGRPILWEGR